jgi:hypothetical protein
MAKLKTAVNQTSGRSDRVREVTAYHEASHVVAALHLGFKVGSASILPDEDSRGHVRRWRFLRDPNTLLLQKTRDRQELKLQHNLVVALAGTEGQRLFSPRSVRKVHGSWDHDNAVRLLFDFGWDNRAIDLFLPFARYQAVNLLEGHWWMVQAVAAALMEKETLSRVEIGKAVQAALQPATKRRGGPASRLTPGSDPVRPC